MLQRMWISDKHDVYSELQLSSNSCVISLSASFRLAIHSIFQFRFFVFLNLKLFIIEALFMEVWNIVCCCTNSGWLFAAGYNQGFIQASFGGIPPKKFEFPPPQTPSPLWPSVAQSSHLRRSTPSPKQTKSPPWRQCIVLFGILQLECCFSNYNCNFFSVSFYIYNRNCNWKERALYYNYYCIAFALTLLAVRPWKSCWQMNFWKGAEIVD